MSITPFKIINDDGSINQSEYNRCIKFLQDYKAGTLKVYAKVTWDNPFEIDMSQPKSAWTLLKEVFSQETNRLLDKTTFDNLRKLFHGCLTRYGSTIHTYGRYLEASKNFVDGPGYMYDVFNNKEDVEVKKELTTDNGITIYYLADENHTVIEYNDEQYSTLVDPSTYPTTNYPELDSVASRELSSNVSGYNVYHGPLCGWYSDFYRLSGQYVGSSTLFYYSVCNSDLYTTQLNGYSDESTGEVINFNYNQTIGYHTNPTKGVTGDVEELRSAIINNGYANAFMHPSVANSTITYYSPLFFTANDEKEWII